MVAGMRDTAAYDLRQSRLSAFFEQLLGHRVHEENSLPETGRAA
jgi:hypothetical protein